jgi:hypothetical protein
MAIPSAEVAKRPRSSSFTASAPTIRVASAARAFAHERRAVAFDYPGYGDSDPTADNTARDGYATTILSALDALGIAKAHTAACRSAKSGPNLEQPDAFNTLVGAFRPGFAGMKSPLSAQPADPLAEQHVPELIDAVRVENMLGDIQSDRGNLLHGRLPQVK